MDLIMCGGGPRSVYGDSDYGGIKCLSASRSKEGTSQTEISTQKQKSKNVGVGSEKVSAVKHSIPEFNQDIAWMGSVTIVIQKGELGYGFAVTGSSPVVVSRVETGLGIYVKGGAGEKAGLLRGDCIVKINDQNVSRSMADSVAKIIRLSETQITLDVHRADHVGDPLNHSSPKQPLLQEVHCPSPWDSSLSFPSPPSSVFSSPQQLSPGSGSHLTSLRDESVCSGEDDPHDSGVEMGKRDDGVNKSIMPFINLSFQSLGSQEQERQSAITALRTLEETFVRVMQSGIQRFSRPLRQYIVSPTEHVTLFQNVEKVVAYSEYHLHQLQEHSLEYTQTDDSPESERYTDVVGGIFEPQVMLMAEAYETYCNGIKNSFRLLLELREEEEFSQFLKQLPEPKQDEPTITQFIQRPLQHVKDLVLAIQKVAVNTSLQHHDYERLKEVVETLRNTCNRINECNTRRTRTTPSVTSAASKPTSLRSRNSHKSRRSEGKIPEQSLPKQEVTSPGQTGSQDDKGMMSIASVDSEVMDIQTRLVFPDYMPAFQLATATRHMIYAGELTLFDGLLWKQLYAVLLSDLLLLLKPDSDGLLVVHQDPIILHTITDINGACPNPSEFTVNSTTNNAACLIFQAPCADLKSTWTNVLHQRIVACRNQLLAPEDNIV